MKKYLLILFSSLFILSACGSNDNQEVTGTEETTESEETSKETVSNDIYFKDGVVETGDLKLEITETKVIPVGEEGNEYGEKPVFAIWYDTTNFTDEEIDPLIWIMYITAIQDNDPNMINELEVGMLPDESHLDTQMNVIKKDGTVENSIAYELDDLETPVTLVAIEGFEDEIGREDYEIK